MSPTENQPTRSFKVRVYCQAYYDSEIKVPANLTKQEAFAYTQQHLTEIPLTELEYINDSDELDTEDLALGNTNFAD